MGCGPGTITADMLAWISPVVRDRSKNTLSQASANITGADDGCARLAALSARLDAALHHRISTDRARLAALSARLDAAKPHPAAA